jgi:protein arginine N-methyltransferase 1
MDNGPIGYSVLRYGQMVNCEPRMSAYAEALRRAVTPGCTVIDIGAGPGIFSILACKYGAGAVIAIDPNDSIDLLPGMASANGCADRITIFKGLSSAYSPPEKADVVVSDIRGILPLFEGHIPAIADARERLLKPGGTLIPSRDILRIAIVSSAKDYEAHEQPWLRNRFGLDLSCGHRFVANTIFKVNLERDALLSDEANLAALDYRGITSPDCSADFDLTATQGGTAHGLLVWFDAELLDGIGFSNAPGEPRQIYGQTLFPFERPVDLGRGDRVSGELGARLIGGGYVWTWRSAFDRAGSNERIEYRQSSFLGSVMRSEKLRKRAGTFVPPPQPVHEVDLYCLSLFDGHRSLQEIAEEMKGRFPEAFPNPSEALNHVARIAAWYEK